MAHEDNISEVPENVQQNQDAALKLSLSDSNPALSLAELSLDNKYRNQTEIEAAINRSNQKLEGKITSGEVRMQKVTAALQKARQELEEALWDVHEIVGSEHGWRDWTLEALVDRGSELRKLFKNVGAKLSAVEQCEEGYDHVKLLVEYLKDNGEAEWDALCGNKCLRLASRF
jgi:hypothetical protein